MKLKWNEGNPAWFEGQTFIRLASIADLKKYYGLQTSDYGRCNGVDGMQDYYCPVKDNYHLYFNQSNLFWKDEEGNLIRYLVSSEIKSMYNPIKVKQKTRKKNDKKLGKKSM